jgi:hypothetical protein
MLLEINSAASEAPQHITPGHIMAALFNPGGDTPER